jgi:hypothetical protein
MPDLLVRAIDNSLAERIKAYALERGRTLNECMLELIEKGLRAHDAEKSSAAIDLHGVGLGSGGSEVHMLGGAWSGDEAAAFREAVLAMKNLK